MPNIPLCRSQSYHSQFQVHKECIDINDLPLFCRFTVRVWHSSYYGSICTSFEWLTNILRSGYLSSAKILACSKKVVSWPPPTVCRLHDRKKYGGSGEADQKIVQFFGRVVNYCSLERAVKCRWTRANVRRTRVISSVLTSQPCCRVVHRVEESRLFRWHPDVTILELRSCQSEFLIYECHCSSRSKL